jgi:hypothetical protein
MYRQCRLPSRTESRVVDLENDFYYAKLAAQTPPEPESIAVFDPNKTCTVGKPFENSARKVEEDLPLLSHRDKKNFSITAGRGTSISICHFTHAKTTSSC